MIKRTLCFSNPTYLSLKNSQLVIKLPEVEKNDTLPESFKAKATTVSCGRSSNVLFKTLQR